MIEHEFQIELDSLYKIMPESGGVVSAMSNQPLDWVVLVLNC